jgi:hypothetical protein
MELLELPSMELKSMKRGRGKKIAFGLFGAFEHEAREF